MDFVLDRTIRPATKWGRQFLFPGAVEPYTKHPDHHDGVEVCEIIHVSQLAGLSPLLFRREQSNFCGVLAKQDIEEAVEEAL